MIDYQELEQRLSTMSERSLLFATIKKEMVKRGRWKNKPRGRVVIGNLKKT